jgi:DNA-binding YbaB/EbfC family protein
MQFRGGMSELMRQASRLQRKIELRKQELKAETVEASSGNDQVKVVANGARELVSVVIAPELLQGEDLSMVQDLIVAASNAAHRPRRRKHGRRGAREGHGRDEDPGHGLRTHASVGSGSRSRSSIRAVGAPPRHRRAHRDAARAPTSSAPDRAFGDAARCRAFGTLHSTREALRRQCGNYGADEVCAASASTHAEIQVSRALRRRARAGSRRHRAGGHSFRGRVPRAARPAGPARRRRSRTKLPVDALVEKCARRTASPR